MVKCFNNVLMGTAELGFALAWASAIALDSEMDDD